MGREVAYYKDRYQGSLTTSTCAILDDIMDMDSKSLYIEPLRNIIFNLEDSVVEEAIKTKGLNLQDKTQFSIGTLRDEQTLGVAFLYYAKSAILGDSVGMGKTVQVSGLYNLLKSEYQKQNKQFRCLILTEKSICNQIYREFIKFTADYAIFIPSGEKKIIDKFVKENSVQDDLSSSIIGSHSLLTTAGFIAWFEQYKQIHGRNPFDLIVVDESSCLGNSTTGITKGFRNISRGIDRRVFLNATPFELQLSVFYTQLSLLDPDFLPAKTHFQRQYCVFDYTGMYPKFTGKYKNQEMFRDKVSYRYFARTRKSRGVVLENCKGSILLSPLSAIQKQWMNKTQMYRAVYDCPTMLDSKIPFDMEHVPKLQSLYDILMKDCEDEDILLLFVYYKDAQEHISKWLTDLNITNAVLNGETSTNDRRRIVSEFQQHKFRVLITNVQKGLNFNSCNYCVFYSFDPNPSKMIQFEGRTTRGFEVKNKTVYLLCSKGTEYSTLNKVIKERAKATAEMSTTDISMIMNLLLNKEE